MLDPPVNHKQLMQLHHAWRDVVTNVQLVDETCWNIAGCRQHQDATVRSDGYS